MKTNKFPSTTLFTLIFFAGAITGNSSPDLIPSTIETDSFAVGCNEYPINVGISSESEPSVDWNSIFLACQKTRNSENPPVLSVEELQSRGTIVHDDFVLNVVPECGVDLMKNCIRLMLNKPVDDANDYIEENHYSGRWASQYLHFLFGLQSGPFVHQTRMPYFPAMEETLSQAGMKTLFIVRDPRDAIVSLLFRIEKMHGDILGLIHVDSTRYFRLSLDEKIESIMTGSYCTNYLSKYWKVMIGWIRSPSCRVIKFEDLVGTRGGGTTERQLEAIDRIAAYLYVDLCEEEKIAIAAHLDSNQNPIGTWHRYFNESNRRLFKKLFGGELAELRYEEESDL